MSTVSLLKVRTPLRFTVYLQNQKTGERIIQSVKDVEWRYVLANRTLNINLPMPSVDNRSIKIGNLKVEITYSGKPKVPGLIKEKELEEGLRREKEDIQKKIAEFYEKAQNWWTEYKHLSPYFATRSVKIYSEDIFGALKPSCNFLRKIQCRGICSPEEAIRFVYLIPFSKKSLTRDKIWLDVDSFLTQGSGSAIEHALLLCSLLLGFGFDAYVCVGRSSDGPHAWVFTRDEEKVGKSYQKVWRIWEGLTGKVMNVNHHFVKLWYQRVSCAFNHERFYANLQATEEVSKIFKFF